MRAGTPPLLTVYKELLVIPDNMPRVVASSSWDDSWVVDRYGESVVFGVEEIASVEVVVSTNGVATSAIIVVGMVFTEEKVGSVGEGKDIDVILEDISVISEVVKAEEIIVLFEVGPAYVSGVISSVDVCMVIVVLGVTEDSNVGNGPTLVEVSEETAVGEKAES